MNKDITVMYVDFESHNGLACDCVVCRVLNIAYHTFCKNFIPKKKRGCTTLCIIFGI